MKKKAFITFSMLTLLLLGGGIWFKYNWHRLPGIIARFKHSTGPNQAIEWQEGPKTRSSDKPNIIVILVDDMGFNEVSSYGGGMGNGQFKTPNIDQLAQYGALCANGYATTAVCSPSRASLLTGRFSTRFGYEYTPAKGLGAFVYNMTKDRVPPPLFNQAVEDALPPMEQMGLPTLEITIAELLKPQGYHTTHIGKWYLGGSKDFIPINHGFDESLWIETGSLFLPEDAPM